VGVSTNLFWMSEADAFRQLSTVRAAGVTWARTDLRWDVLEPSPGAFDWSRADGLMAAAARAGVDMLGILDYSAPWASSSGSIYSLPSDPATFAAYAGAVVGRYGTGGTFWAERPDLPARPLAAVEVWNEPWGYWFSKPNPDPARYAALVRATTTAVRAVDPGVTVVVAGDHHQVRTDGAAVGWIDVLLDTDPGLPAFVDAWSVHPYPDPKTAGPDDPGPLPWHYDRVTLTQQITAARGASRPIWITEIGWSTAASAEGVSEAQQAAHVSGALADALGEWRSFVAVTFIYSWSRDGTDPTDTEAHYGLLRNDGSPKPAWAALTSYLTG
jgi:hypothetical protein